MTVGNYEILFRLQVNKFTNALNVKQYFYSSNIGSCRHKYYIVMQDGVVIVENILVTEWRIVCASTAYGKLVIINNLERQNVFWSVNVDGGFL